MSLWTYAIITAAELKAELSGSSQIVPEADKADLESACNRASAAVEGLLRREVVTRGSVVEYHSPSRPACHLSLLQYPVISVTSIYEDEDWPRTYGAAYLLTASTDYQVVGVNGKVARLTSSGLSTWACGWRTIKVTYSAGWALANVPLEIKDACLKLAALEYREQKRGQQGLSAISDQLGNVQRFARAGVTPELQRDLLKYTRLRCGETGERDS